MTNQLLLVLFLLLLSAGSCTSTRPVTVTYKGQLLTLYCAFAVVDILNSDVFEEGVEWRDGRGTLHRNAFTVGNICDFYKAGLKAGDTFEYRIIDAPVDQECEVCLGYIETPSLRKTIQVVRKLNE